MIPRPRHLRALADHLLPRLAPSKRPTEGGVPEARRLPEIPAQRPKPTCVEYDADQWRVIVALAAVMGRAS